jgi:Putative phospholipid-binding domain.
VRNGVVHLWGTLLDERQRGAIRAATENIPGVKGIEDHLVWVEPTTGIAIPAPETANATKTKAS